MTVTQHDRKEIPEYRNTITAESVDDESIRVCFDGMDYMLNREAARILILTLAQHVWPELTDTNALRFLANETLVRENEQLEALWQQIVAEILQCEPIPACKRGDGQLEPPHEVVSRLRRELQSAKSRVAELEAENARMRSRGIAEEIYEERAARGADIGNASIPIIRGVLERCAENPS